MKTVIIGGSYAGVQTALTLRKGKADEEVVIFEKRDFICFIDEKEIAGRKKTKHFDEMKLLELGIQVKKGHVVLEVDISQNRLLAEDLTTGEVVYETYDNLVLAMGSVRKGPELFDCQSDGDTHTYKGHLDSTITLEKIENARTITIVGGGYTGIELANNLRDMDKQVRIIESSDTILHRYFDKEIIQVLEKRITASGMILLLNDTVLQISLLEDGKKLVCTSEEKFTTDLVLFAILGRPNTKLVRGQVAILPDHTVKVNEKMQTTVPNVYAVGDLVAYPGTNADGSLYKPLVSETMRTATVAAMSIAGKAVSFQPYQQTNMTNIFDTYSASMGITLRQAEYECLNVRPTLFKQHWPAEQQVNFLQLLLLFHEEDDVLVGAQILSSNEITALAEALSTAVNRKMTVKELKEMDFTSRPESDQMDCLKEAVFQHLKEEEKWHIVK